MRRIPSSLHVLNRSLARFAIVMLVACFLAALPEANLIRCQNPGGTGPSANALDNELDARYGFRDLDFGKELLTIPFLEPLAEFKPPLRPVMDYGNPAVVVRVKAPGKEDLTMFGQPLRAILYYFFEGRLFRVELHAIEQPATYLGPGTLPKGFWTREGAQDLGLTIASVVGAKRLRTGVGTWSVSGNATAVASTLEEVSTARIYRSFVDLLGPRPLPSDADSWRNVAIEPYSNYIENGVPTATVVYDASLSACVGYNVKIEGTYSNVGRRVRFDQVATWQSDHIVSADPGRRPYGTLFDKMQLRGTLYCAFTATDIERGARRGKASDFLGPSAKSPRPDDAAAHDGALRAAREALEQNDHERVFEILWRSAPEGLRKNQEAQALLATAESGKWPLVAQSRVMLRQKQYSKAIALAEGASREYASPAFERSTPDKTARYAPGYGARLAWDALCQSLQARFAPQASDGVLDRESGLVWKRISTSDIEYKNYKDKFDRVVAVAELVKPLQFSGWRLPTRGEAWGIQAVAGYSGLPTDVLGVNSGDDVFVRREDNGGIETMIVRAPAEQTYDIRSTKVYVVRKEGDSDAKAGWQKYVEAVEAGGVEVLMKKFDVAPKVEGQGVFEVKRKDGSVVRGKYSFMRHNQRRSFGDNHCDMLITCEVGGVSEKIEYSGSAPKRPKLMVKQCGCVTFEFNDDFNKNYFSVKQVRWP